MAKRWRVTQSSDRTGYIAHKDYRFNWYARLIARTNSGVSPLGFHEYSCTVEEVEVD